MFSSNTTCPTGYTYHYNTCLMATTFQSTFEGFKTYCGINGNGIVAILPTLATSRWFYEYVRAWGDTSRSYFIGGNKVGDVTQWVWYSTNSYFTYFNWDSGQPDNTFGSEGCMTYNQDGNGRWNDYACDWSSWGLCQASPIGFVPSVTPTIAPTATPTITPVPTIVPTAVPSIYCPPGFALIAGTGYCYKYVSTLLNWFDAERNCNILGGHLTSITSSSQASYIHQYLLSLGATDVWIGGNDISMEGNFTWIDGSHWVYGNWWSGEPGYYDTEHCISTVQSWGTFAWSDSPCSSTKASLCKYVDGGIVSSKSKSIQ